MTINITNKHIVDRFDLSSKEETTKLVAYFADRGIKYIPSKKPLPLYVAPVHLLNNALGLFAKEALPSGMEIGTYIGETVSSSHPSLYAFNTKKSSVSIDAAKVRNHTALINHSNHPNVQAYQRRKGNQVCMRVGKELIPKDHQLFINYGPNFFSDLDLTLYLDPSDGPKSIEVTVKENAHLYTDVMRVSDVFKNQFFLEKSTILPTKSMHAISFPDSHFHISEGADLWCYEVKEDKTYGERFTSLMAACYLGVDHAIEKLVDIVDINKQNLNTGETALFYLIQGHSKNRASLLRLMIEKGAIYNLAYKRNKNILHFILKNGDADIMESLLQSIDEGGKTELIIDLASEFGLPAALFNTNQGARQKLIEHMPDSLCKQLLEEDAEKINCYEIKLYKDIFFELREKLPIQLSKKFKIFFPDEPEKPKPKKIKFLSQIASELYQEELVQQVDPLSCPITSRIFLNPVLANDGIIYEKKALEYFIPRMQENPHFPKSFKPSPQTETKVKEFLGKHPEFNDHIFDSYLYFKELETPNQSQIAKEIYQEELMQQVGLLSCPITSRVFLNPVLADDGIIYEKKALEYFIPRMQENPHFPKGFKPNPQTETKVKEFLEKHPEFNDHIFDSYLYFKELETPNQEQSSRV